MKITKSFLYFGCATATIWILYSLFLNEQRPRSMSAAEEDDDLARWV
jgi:hypothetical protein